MKEKLLLPGEESRANFEGLRVDDQSYFSCMVTDRRLIFWQPGLLHDARLDAVVALSWGRLRPPFCVIPLCQKHPFPEHSVA
jgi:hypothetical protein